MGGFVAKPIQGQPCSLRLYAIQRAFVKGFPQFYSPERTVVVFFRPLPHIWWPFLRKPAPFVRNFRKAAPGDAAAGGQFAGKAKPHGGVETPPYRARERGRSTARSRQDQIARAACRPPLRPNGKQICRARVLTAPDNVPAGREFAGRSAVWQAWFWCLPHKDPLHVGAACTPPGECGGRQEHCGQGKFARRGRDPALQGAGPGTRPRPFAAGQFPQI